MDKEVEYPRVLVITCAVLNRSSATGITFGSLFSGWPLECIAQVYDQDGVPDSDLCTDYRRLTWRDIKVESNIRRLFSSGNNNSKSKYDGIPPAVSGKRSNIKALMSSVRDMLPYTIDTECYNWLDDFRPQVVFANLGNIRWEKLVASIAMRYGIPIVPFFNDDWPSTFYSGNALQAPARLMLLKNLSRVLKCCPGGIGGSPEMAKEYTVRYGIPFTAFMNCTTVADKWSGLGIQREALEFAYVGGLHLERWRSLHEIGEALTRLNSDGYPCKLSVYAPDSDLRQFGEKLAMPPVVNLMRPLSAAEVPGILKGADVLVHVESFDKSIRQYTRLSLSTKIPQYLAAGRPILGYGPGELASMKYLDSTSAALVVPNEDQELLENEIRRLVSEASLRETMGCAGWGMALEYHNAIKERERFRTLLASAVVI